MKRLIYLWLIAFIGFVGARSLGAQNQDAISEIQNILHAQQDAWNRGQIEEFMNGYWRSDQTVFVSGDEVTRGWQKVLDRYKKKYSDRSKMGTLTFSALEITPLSNDSAVVLGSWKLDRANDTPSQNASPARTSGAAGEPHGRFTLVFRRFPEGWRIVH